MTGLGLGLGGLGTKGLGLGLDNYLHFGKIYNSKNYHWNKSERNICHLLGPSKSTIHTARRGTVTLINRKQFVTRNLGRVIVFLTLQQEFSSHTVYCFVDVSNYVTQKIRVIFYTVLSFSYIKAGFQSIVDCTDDNILPLILRVLLH